MLLLLLLNIATFALLSTVYPGFSSSKPHYYRKESGHTTTYVVIAGMLNQARIITRHLTNTIAGDIIVADYSSTGYNPKKFAKTIADFMDSEDKTNITLITVCLGTQPGLVLAESQNLPLIAINPGTPPQSARPDLKRNLLAIGIPCAILKYLLGWISFLPIGNLSRHPNHKGYSLATFVDQIFWGLYGTSPYPNKNATIILSNDDDLIFNDVIEDFFSGSPAHYVDASHARLSDPAFSHKLSEILKKEW